MKIYKGIIEATNSPKRLSHALPKNANWIESVIIAAYRQLCYELAVKKAVSFSYLFLISFVLKAKELRPAIVSYDPVFSAHSSSNLSVFKEARKGF